MFLIPIGHSETSVRRLPWITFSVMGLCVAALILSGAASSATDKRVHERFGEAFEYYLQHPYLELDPEFGAVVDAETGGQAQLLAEANRGVGPARDPAVQAEEQAELDRLVARSKESLAAHPYVRFGLVPQRFSFFGLLTHMFMHAGWFHLIGNLLMLYLVGPYIEDVWGRPLYGGFYVVSGIVAALGFIAMNPGLQAPLVGASGAVAGVMGAFLVRYWSTKIRFFYMVGLFWRGTFWAPAAVMLPLWLGEQLFMALLTSGVKSQGGVAYWAHIVGFGFGAVVAWTIRSKRIEERYLHPAIEAKVTSTVVDNSAIDRAMNLHVNGQGDRAIELLVQETRRLPSNRDAALALWSVALESERPAQAGPAMLRLIQDELKSGEQEDALRHWEELSTHVVDLRMPPALCARLAQALTAGGDRDQAAMMLRRALLEAGSSLTPATALQIARAARSVDRATASAALRLVLAAPDLAPDDRDQVERLLEELSPAPVSRV